MLLMETPRDTCLEGSLTVGLAEIVGKIAPDESGAKQRATKGTRVSKVAPPPSVGDVIIPTASIETIERLSLSAEAVKNRYNAAIAHFEKQVLREASNPKLR